MKIEAPAETLDELLSYNDEKFVRIAYQTLLGRTPDPQGLRYYLTRVRLGISKVEILTQLRNSVEGKSRQIKVGGLDKAIKAHMRRKNLFLWPFLYFARVKEADEAFQQNFRRIENALYRQNLLKMQQLTEINNSLILLRKALKKNNRYENKVSDSSQPDHAHGRAESMQEMNEMEIDETFTIQRHLEAVIAEAETLLQVQTTE